MRDVEMQNRKWGSPCGSLAGSRGLCPHPTGSDAKTVDGTLGQEPQASAAVNETGATEGDVGEAVMPKTFREKETVNAGLAEAASYYGLPKKKINSA
jgi:hypothetical protein